MVAAIPVSTKWSLGVLTSGRRVREPQPEIRNAAAALIARTRANPSGRKSHLYVNNRLEGNALTTLEAIVKILDPD